MSKLLKSIFFISIVVLSFFNISKSNVFADQDETSFIVTAYYSPLPNQKRYTTGSYAGDKRLNGEGHTTASGKGVYTGILAAPTKYPFGTKIYFNGLGIGAVEDRGGAIVKAGKRGYEFDRIDIWMGYGDEGLQRALKWGKRTIKGKVVSKKSVVNLQFTKNVLSNIQNIKVNPEVHEKENVKKLQEDLHKLKIYKGPIDGKYSSIKNTLIDFQLKNKLITSREEEAAGWFGPKTYTELLKKYGTTEVIIKNTNTKIIEANPKIQIILGADEIKLNGDKPQVEEVKKVQELFKKLGMYNGPIDGKFSNIRRKLLDFQKQAGIIKKDTSWGAGYFGEKTKAALITQLDNNYASKTNTSNNKKTIKDISYGSLDNVAKKIKRMKNRKAIIKKLEYFSKNMTDTNNKKKIIYLINKIK